MGIELAEMLTVKDDSACDVARADALPQNYLDRVVRAKWILETTLELALEYFGQKNAITLAVIAELAAFNRNHGVIAEAEASVELITE